MVKSTKYYDILNSTPSSTPSQLKKSYIKLSKEFHPDKNKSKDAEEKFKDISKAYQVLSDPEKREKYDYFGEDFENSSEMSQDPFGMFGGFNFGRSRQQKANPIEINIELTLEEAYLGISKDISYDRLVMCEKCDGDGTKVGKFRKSCKKCNGTGQSIKTVRTNRTIQKHINICENCMGKGKFIEECDKCDFCDGERVKIEKTEKNISIPPGIEHDSTINMNMMGNFEPDITIPGDLHLHIKIKKHPFFKRNKMDLECMVNIDLYDALNEYSVIIEHLDGIKYSLQGKGSEKTLQNDIYRMKDMGFPDVRSPDKKGDLLVKVNILLPEKISFSNHEKDLLSKIFRHSKEKNEDCVKIPFDSLEVGPKKKEKNYKDEELEEGNVGCVHQ